MCTCNIVPCSKSEVVVISTPHRTFLAFFLLAVLTILAPSAHANQPPKAVASAGVDPNTGQVFDSVTLFIGPADSGIPFTIAGGGSSDPDGDTLTYRWDCTDQATGNKCIFALGVATNQMNFRPTFPPGTYDITLTVNDGQGHTATDSVRVKVLVDLSPPTVTPPDNESVSATEAGGARGSASSDLHKFLFNSATATDNSTAIFTQLPPRVNGADVDDTTLLPHGTTTVTFRIADNFGNVGTATADVFVTDLQSGDLFVGVQPTVFTLFGGLQTKGLVQRIRGGSVTDFCQSPDPPNSPLPLLGAPVFWRRPDQIVVDSKGQVAFLADLRWGGSVSGFGLLRCNLPGQPPEQLAIFPQASDLSSPLPPGSSIDPSWPVPFPGRTFYGALPTTGLHLRKTKHVLIDDNVNNGNPQIITEEKYVLAFQDSVDPGQNTGHIGSLSLNTESLVFEEGDDARFPVGVGAFTSSQDALPEMFFHSKMETVSFLGLLSFPAPVAKTYVTGFGVLRRIHEGFTVQLTANTSAGTVQFGVQAFGGFTQIPSSPANSPQTGFIMDDITVPNPPSGCNPVPPTRGDWPQIGGGYVSFGLAQGVTFEKNFGLVVIRNGSWFGQLDEALFDLDAQNDAQSYFARPETGCRIEPVVNFTPLSSLLLSDRMAASPNGLFATLASAGRVVQATGTLDVSDVATFGGTLAPRGLGAYPPQLGNVQLSALIVRIDSPVDVVLTDALGRRVGVSNGQAIDEFGGQAFDSGPLTHPRLYIIQFPQPGNYSVRSTGTGTGPFTVHIYSVDSAKHVTEHLISSGNASPGSSGKHDFTLDAQNKIAFSNAAPVAEAGFDQTADADASGNATFSLDGSLSSDPDGDSLTFTWAGPFGILSGAQINATLPVGVHVLTLTVEDGKGGSAEDTVQLTVNAVAPPADTTSPVLTLPADIVVQASSSAGAVVNFSASASDAVDGAVLVTCVPASGSTFALGTTSVNCSATDLSNNSASGSFDVTVNAPPSGGPQITLALAGQGRILYDLFYVDVLLTNTGGADALDVRIGELQVRLLDGSGSIIRRTSLPRELGTMAPGAAKTTRLFFEVPRSVTQFSLTTQGRYRNAVGETLRFSFPQVFTP